MNIIKFAFHTNKLISINISNRTHIIIAANVCHPNVILKFPPWTGSKAKKKKTNSIMGVQQFGPRKTLSYIRILHHCRAPIVSHDLHIVFGVMYIFMCERIRNERKRLKCVVYWIQRIEGGRMEWCGSLEPYRIPSLHKSVFTYTIYLYILSTKDVVVNVVMPTFFSPPAMYPSVVSSLIERDVSKKRTQKATTHGKNFPTHTIDSSSSCP